MERIVSFLEKSRIGVISLLFSYAVFLGYLYNFFQFNIGLKFNIFDYLNITDMILTLIVDIKLIYIVFLLISVILIKVYKNKYLLYICTLISICLIIIIGLFSYTNTEDNVSKSIIVISMVIIFIFNLIFFNYNKEGLKLDEKDLKKLHTDINLEEIKLTYKQLSSIKNTYLDTKALMPSLKIQVDLKDNPLNKFEHIFSVIKYNLLNARSKLLRYNHSYDTYILDEFNKFDEYIDSKVLLLKKFEGHIILKEIFISLGLLSIVACAFGYIASSEIKRIEIKLIRNIDPENKIQLYDLYKVTSSHVVVKTIETKEILVFNKDDISFIKFKNLENNKKDKNITSCIKTLDEFEIQNDIQISNALDHYFRNENNNFNLTLGNLIISKIGSLLNAEFDNKISVKFDSLLKSNIVNDNEKYKLKGEVIINDILFKDLSFKLYNINQITELTTLINNLNIENKYIINLTGISNLKKISIYNNTIKDNYTLSLARANSVKEIIVDTLIRNKFNLFNININTFGDSNQNIINKKSEAKVVIRIYEYEKS